MTAVEEPHIRDPAAAEAAAERLMAQHRLQQRVDTARVRHDGIVGRVIAIGALALGGALMGALLGALRGHALAAALLMGLASGLLAMIQTRPR